MGIQAGVITAVLGPGITAEVTTTDIYGHPPHMHTHMDTLRTQTERLEKVGWSCRLTT